MAAAVLIGFRHHKQGEDPVEAAKRVPDEVRRENPLVAAAVEALLADRT
jgi:hypothetical protein